MTIGKALPAGCSTLVQPLLHGVRRSRISLRYQAPKQSIFPRPACQAMWMRRLLEDMNEKQLEPTVIFCDNKSAIAIAKNPAMHGRTKHIDTRYHFIRGLIADESLILLHCCTNEQVADVLTKALPIQKHIFLTEQLGVKSF